MAKTVSIVITDLDNTLYDWVKFWQAKYATLLDRLGQTLPCETGKPGREVGLSPSFREGRKSTAVSSFQTSGGVSRYRFGSVRMTHGSSFLRFLCRTIFLHPGSSSRILRSSGERGRQALRISPSQWPVGGFRSDSR